jgi:hypothetical protein
MVSAAQYDGLVHPVRSGNSTPVKPRRVLPAGCRTRTGIRVEPGIEYWLYFITQVIDVIVFECVFHFFSF